MVSLRRKTRVNYALKDGFESDKEERDEKQVTGDSDSERSEFRAASSAEEESSEDEEMAAENENESEHDSDTSQKEKENQEEDEDDGESVISVGAIPVLMLDDDSESRKPELSEEEEAKLRKSWFKFKDTLGTLIGNVLISIPDADKPDMRYVAGGGGRGRSKASAEFSWTKKYVRIRGIIPKESNQKQPTEVAGKKKGKSKATEDSDTVAAGGCCPVPGCPRSKPVKDGQPAFKVLPSFKYHYTNHKHGLRSLIRELVDSSTSSSTAESGSEETDLMKLQKMIQVDNLPEHHIFKNMEDQFIVITDELLFSWPGDEDLKRCTFDFDISELYEAPAVDEEGKEVVKEAPPAAKKRSHRRTEEASADPEFQPDPRLQASKKYSDDLTVIPDYIKEQMKSKVSDIKNNAMPEDAPKKFVKFNLGKFSSSTSTLAPLASQTLDAKDTLKHGCIMNVGQRPGCSNWMPIYDEASAYLSVTTLDNVELYTNSNLTRYERKVSSDSSIVTPSMLQIWHVAGLNIARKKLNETVDPPLECRFQSGFYLLNSAICDEFQQYIVSVEWLPFMADDDILGVAVVVFDDGMMAAYAVPRASFLDQNTKHASSSSAQVPLTTATLSPIAEHCRPGIKFTCTSIGYGFIAAGNATGDIAIWTISEFLKSKTPSQYYPAQQGYISMLKWQPKLPNYSGDLFIASCGYDGQIIISNSTRPWSVVSTGLAPHVQASANSGFIMKMEWLSDGIYFAGVDRLIRWAVVLPRVTPDESGFPFAIAECPTVTFHDAHVLSLSGSPYHPFIASTATDGSLQICSIKRHRSRNLQHSHVREFKLKSTSSVTNNKNDGQSSSSKESSKVPFEVIEIDETIQARTDAVPRTDNVVPIPVFPRAYYATNVEWHPEFYHSCNGWLLTSLELGMVRIESVCRQQLLGKHRLQALKGKMPK